MGQGEEGRGTRWPGAVLLPPPKPPPSEGLPPPQAAVLGALAPMRGPVLCTGAQQVPTQVGSLPRDSGTEPA